MNIALPYPVRRIRNPLVVLKLVVIFFQARRSVLRPTLSGSGERDGRTTFLFRKVVAPSVVIKVESPGHVLKPYLALTPPMDGNTEGVRGLRRVGIGARGCATAGAASRWSINAACSGVITPFRTIC